MLIFMYSYTNTTHICTLHMPTPSPLCSHFLSHFMCYFSAFVYMSLLLIDIYDCTTLTHTLYIFYLTLNAEWELFIFVCDLWAEVNRIIPLWSFFSLCRSFRLIAMQIRWELCAMWSLMLSLDEKSIRMSFLARHVNRNKIPKLRSTFKTLVKYINESHTY